MRAGDDRGPVRPRTVPGPGGVAGVHRARRTGLGRRTLATSGEHQARAAALRRLPLRGQVRICFRWPPAGTTSAGRTGRDRPALAVPRLAVRADAPVTAAAPRPASAPGRGP